MKTKSKTVKIRESDELRMRIINLKATFTKGFDYTPLYQYEFGHQTPEQLNKIRSVWNLRETDALITKNLEIIANKIK